MPSGQSSQGGGSSSQDGGLGSVIQAAAVGGPVALAIVLALLGLVVLVPAALLGVAMYLRRHVNAYARVISTDTQKTSCWEQCYMARLPRASLEVRLKYFTQQFQPKAPKYQPTISWIFPRFHVSA